MGATDKYLHIPVGQETGGAGTALETVRKAEKRFFGRPKRAVMNFLLSLPIQIR